MSCLHQRRLMYVCGGLKGGVRRGNQDSVPSEVAGECVWEAEEALTHNDHK